MQAPAPYQVPAKEIKEESKKAKGGLRSKGTPDAMSGETRTPCSEDEGEEEADIPSPQGKKRTTSKDFEVEAPKRGKMSLSGGSGSGDDVAAQFLRNDKPFAESPARSLPQQSSSSGDLLPEMMESETPPQASSPLRADDFEVSSRRVSPDHQVAVMSMATAHATEVADLKQKLESADEDITLANRRLDEAQDGAAAVETHRAELARAKEQARQTFDRLSEIANELQGLGAKDITDHEVVKKLLRSLDSSSDTLVLMIRERANFKTLNSADIMERLNTHEEQEEEKRDLYGSSQRKNHALKAVADSSSDGNAKENSDDPERLIKDLALITKRFQRLDRKSQFQKKDCPLWEAEIRASGRYDSGNYRGKSKSKNYDSDDEKKTNKFFKKKDNSTSKSSSRSSSRNPSKSSSNRKNNYRKAKAYIGKGMDSDEEESSDSEEADESDEDSDSGMAGIACATSPAANFFGNPSSDYESPAYCFMDKESKEKVSSKHHKVHSSDQYSSDEDDHDKLIKIANIQQNSLGKIEKTLRKSEGLLVEEMEKNPSLTEEYSTLKS
nr:uncharacterized protein LOC109770581 [Aegilops tauschii subsp. strangulata]